MVAVTRTWVAVCLLTVVQTAAARRLDQTDFRDQELGVWLRTPKGWYPTTQTGFPSILVKVVPKEGPGQMSLSVVPSPRTLQPGLAELEELAQENNAALSAVGLKILHSAGENFKGRPSWLVIAESEEQRIQQRYLLPFPRPENEASSQTKTPTRPYVFVLTLTGPSEQFERLTVDYQRVLSNFRRLTK